MYTYIISHQYDNAHTYQYKNMLIHDLTNLINEIAILIINMKQLMIAWRKYRSNSSRLSFGFNIILCIDKPLLKQLYKLHDIATQAIDNL